MLPQDTEFLAYLAERHGVELTQDDLCCLTEFHFYLRNKTNNQLANDPNAVYYPVENGKILGILAFAAIGFFAAPLLGVGGIIGALMGAAIGFRLFGSKKQGGEQKEEKAPAQAYGFESVAALPAIGGPIPLNYCDRDTNPNGGILTSGFIVNSRVETRQGAQKLYQLAVLGYGQHGAIDEASMTINDQPRNNFFEDEVVTKVSLGTSTQAPFGEFPYYCQAVSASTQNQMGLDSRAILTSNTSSATIVLKEEDVPAFSPGDTYRHNGQTFRIKAKTGSSVIANKVINQVDKQPVYAVWDAHYTTSKRVNEIQVNLNAQYWASAQDKDKNVITVNLANVWDIYLTPLATGIRTKLLRIHVRSKTRTNLRRTFFISGLPLGKYKLELVTITRDEQPEGEQTYSLKDDGVLRSYPVANGWTFTAEGGLLESVKADNQYIDRTQWAAQGSAPCQITTVNEIVYPQAIGQIAVVGYPNMPMVGLIATASAQLQGQPNLKTLVRKGRSNMRVLGGADIAGIGSNEKTLVDNSDYITNYFNLGYFKIGDICRNLDKRTESVITSVSNGVITTAQSCNWQQGDRFLVYYYGCSNYFPDIYVDTLTSIDGGLGNFIDADFFVDYPSIVDSKFYCRDNGFFWDGSITEPTPWAQWATRESLGSLLFPSRIGGKFALISEHKIADATPIALFNASNIIEGSFMEEFAERQELNTLIVSYKDGSDAKFQTKTIVIQTQQAYDGEVSVVEESLSLDSVTNFAQAEKVGQVFLKTRLLQDRAISFKTGLQGAYIQPGDLIYVQHLITEFDRECSGFVAQNYGSNQDPNGSYTCVVRLSAPVRDGISSDTGYMAAVFRLEDGGMQTDLRVESFYEESLDKNLLSISGLKVPLLPPGENRNGDYCVCNKVIENKRIYRVNSIEPSTDGTVGISGVLWVREMLSPEGLITVI